MIYETHADFRRAHRSGKGPVALVFCEDEFLVEETIARLRALRFSEIIAVGPGAAAAPQSPDVHVIGGSGAAWAAHAAEVTPALEGRWMLACFNGEFPFFPFCETRGIIDFTDFLRSERRASCMGYAIDLYSDRLIEGAPPDLDDVYFDAEGWYGFDRDAGAADVYGGLGWRFEEYSPLSMSRVNRPALFLVSDGVALRDDLWLSNDALNTLACPWHNNPTMALMSFRRARRMLSHPNFRNAVDTLMWPNSRRFEWSSDQLSGLGLIEAGQWI